MGERFYFLTDPAALTPQTASQAFGPKDLTNFRLTDTHWTSLETPAIAICDGTICVQDAGPGILNIILKPRHQPALNLPFIKFYIYKGVKKASLVSGNELIAGSAPFVDSIRGSWQDDDQTNPITESADAIGLALNNTEDGYGDADPIDNLFYTPNPLVQLPRVAAGDDIGQFQAGAIGLEIVLERLGFTPSIGQARSEETLLTALANAGGTTPEDFDQFMHWHSKEACLSYLDPCAFFGSFGAATLYFRSGSTDIKCRTPQEVFDGVLQTFFNKHRIYLDIRNDHGLSLNYFKNYGFTVSFAASEAGQGLTPVTTDWPIYTLERQQLLNAGSVSGDYFYTCLCLPQGQNSAALIYLSRAFVKRGKRPKPRERLRELKPAEDSGLTGLLEPVKICLATVDAGTNFCSGYCRVNLYNLDRRNIQDAGLPPNRQFYLDGLFRPLEMKQTVTKADGGLHFTVWHEEILVNMQAVGGPAYIGHLGIAQDRSNTTVFTIPEIYIGDRANGSGPKPLRTLQNGTESTELSFLERIASGFNQRTVVKRILQFESGAGSAEVMLFEEDDPGALLQDLRDRDSPDDWVSVVLENSEFAQLLASVEAMAGALPVPSFLVVSQNNSGLDMDGNQFTRLSLSATVYAQNGAQIERRTVSLNMEVLADGNT